MMDPIVSPEIEVVDGNKHPFRTLGGTEPSSAAQWRAAEGRLYPLILVDSGLYEAAVMLVGEAADVLRRQCGTIAELIRADAARVLAKCPSTPLMTALGFDPNTAFEAACACRWRELAANQPDAALDASQGGWS